MSKELAFLNEVIFPFHPVFSKDKAMRREWAKHPRGIRIEHLVEETIAHIGMIKHTAETGRDFDDNSDSKTATVIINKKGNFYIEIGSLENKIGAIRICLYNKYAGRIDYFFIPAEDVEGLSLPCYGKAKDKKRLRFTWNKEADRYNKYEKYRMPDFKSMATAKSNNNIPAISQQPIDTPTYITLGTCTIPFEQDIEAAS